MPDLLHNAGVAAFVLIVAGGVVYTLGGIVYALKRPNPYPGVFGFHEVFHLCTLVAALCHYVADLVRRLRLIGDRPPPRSRATGNIDASLVAV